jgi:iron complex outermembrane receptor protein
MQRATRTLLGAIAAATASGAGTGPIAPAVAQQQTALEEIVVTARKREESLLEVPLAITAVGAAQIDTAGLTNLEDVQQMAPGFFFQDGVNQLRNDRASRFYIVRGLAFGSAVTTEAVAVFLDGAPIVGAGEPGTMVDVERVEILRGPQSAYFGRNTYAGAINIVTKNPGPEWKGQVEVEGGQYRSRSLSGSVNGPFVADKLSIRLSGQSERVGGQYTNVADGATLGDRQTDQVSASLYATPSNELSMKAYISHFAFDDGPDARYAFLGDVRTCNVGGAQRWICGNAPAYVPSLLGFNYDVDSRVRQVFPASYFGLPLRDKAGTTTLSWLSNFQINYDLGDGMALDFIAARNSRKTSLISDEDNRDTRNMRNPLFGQPGRDVRSFLNELAFIDRAVKDWSAEIRFTSNQEQSLRYTFGGSYLDGKAQNSYLYGDGFAGYRIPSSSGIIAVKTKAVFGALYYDFNDRWTVSIEARAQWDDNRSTPFANTTVVNQRLTEGPPQDALFKNVGPRAIVEYQATEEAMIYASWARGFLPGGFNARLFTLTAAQIAELRSQIDINPTIAEESQDTYELGTRVAVLDGRGFVNATGYIGKISEHQITQTGAVTLANGQRIAVSGVVNGGKIDFYGIELESAVAVAESVTLNGSFSWNHSEYKVHNCINCQLYRGLNPLTGGTGNEVENSPEYTASLTATYRNEFNSTFDWYVGGESFYTSGYWVEDSNILKTEGRTIVNVRAGFESKALRVEGYVKNLFNNDDYPSISTTLDRFANLVRTPMASLPDKRRWGVRAKYSF